MKKLTDEDMDKIIDDGFYLKRSINPRASLKRFYETCLRAMREKSKQSKKENQNADISQ